MRVCVIQFKPGRDIKKNLERAEEYLEVARNPDFVLVGGEFAISEPGLTDPSPLLAELARRHGCNIVAPVNGGGNRATGSGEKGRSSMYIISRSGEVLGVQDKRALSSKEKGSCKRGDRVQTFEVDGVRIALMRGMDILDHLYSSKIRDADIVFFSTMATDDMMFELAKARALDLKAYFAMASYIGRHSGREFVGNAAIIEPEYAVADGENVLHQSQVLRHIDDEGLVQAEFDVQHVRTMKAKFSKRKSRAEE